MNMTNKTARLAVTSGVLAALLGAGAAWADEVADGLARATEIIEAHRTVPAFKAPGEPFDIRAVAAGKKMLSIPNTSSNQFLKGIIQREIEVGKEIGLEVREWENQGQPNQWVQGIEYAIANDFDIVDLISGVNPAVIEPQLEAARAAGVKVYTSHFYDPSQPANPLLAGDLPFSFYTQGWLLGNWMTYKTGGAAQAIVIKSDEVPPTAPLVQGIRDAFEKNCPNCVILQEINVGITEWGTKIQTSLQAALLSNPTTNYVIPIYDSMSQFVVPAVELTGKSETVKVATGNGTPFVLDFIREGKVEMDLGESLDWVARATIDGYMRDLAGLPMPKELAVPFYVFESANIESAGIPAEPNKGYGDEYVKGFKENWQLK